MIRTVKLLLLSFASMLLISTSAFAQATQVRFSVYNVGAASPLQSTVAPYTAVTCNQPVTQAATTVNEAKGFAWDDPVNTGKQCQIDRSAFFGGLPPSSGYQFTITELDASGADWSLESAKTGPLAMRAAARQNLRPIK